MSDTGDGAKAAEHVKAPRRHRRGGLIGYVKRKLKDRKAKRQAENPTDRAARRTADATYWIAAFTIVLAIVAVSTLYEVLEGAKDTHDLATAAKDQAAAAKAQVEEMKKQTVDTHDLAVDAGSQVALLRQQMEGVEAARVAFWVAYSNQKLRTQMTNGGRVIATNVKIKVTLAKVNLLSQKIEKPVTRTVVQSQLSALDAQGIPGEYNEDIKAFELTPSELESIRNMESTVRYEWEGSFDDGFGHRVVKQQTCWYLLPDHYVFTKGSNPAVYPFLTDFPCDELSQRLEKARASKKEAEAKAEAN